MGFLSLILPFVGLATFGCTHKPWSQVVLERQSHSRAHSAAWEVDHFSQVLEPAHRKNRSTPDQFFFKKCSVGERSPFPNRHVWECSGGGM